MNNQNTIDAAKQLLDLAVIRKSYANEIERLTGARFNVFEIWGDSASEVKHSAFLAVLLNSEGSHGMGDAFVSLFVEMLNDCISMSKGNRKELEFDTKTCHSKCEHNIGNGRIDILLRDSKERKIIIENKIYAEDQFEQLSKYHNYGENEKTSFSLFYLTLYNQEASDASRKDLKLDEHYYNITYSEHIINWLDKCAKEAVQKPIVRETIQQYIYLLKKMTNQMASDNLKTDFVKLLRENKDYFSVVQDLKQAEMVLRKEILGKIFDSVKVFVESEKDKFKIKDYTVEFFWDENNVCFYFGYILIGSNGHVTDEKIRKEYYAKIRDEIGRKKITISGGSFGWTYLEGKSSFRFSKWIESESSQYLYNLLISDEGLNEFMAPFKREMQQFIDHVKKCLKDEIIE